MKDFDPMALNLFYLLMSRGRLEMLADILDEYQRLLYKDRGIERAEVLTAIPLADKERDKVVDTLEKIAGKKLLVDARVDTGLVGGIVARIEGKLLDGSTRSKLNALKKEMAEAGR
jgi:F-type H+-transporting ATPase subunit delta